MKKPRVLFPRTEAGLGHIIPLNSIAAEFERLYGDKVEVVRSNFFTEGGNKKLAGVEENFKKEVTRQNKHASYGYFGTFNMEFWRIHLSTWATMKFIKFGNRKAGKAHMDELDPDIVVSTHWATNYYAIKCKKKPLTVMYCPDVDVNPLFSYKCDEVMVSTETGYEKALKKHPIRFNKENLHLVTFPIREEAFSFPAGDKRELRRKLGLDEDKFTVILAEGGYGIGKMEEICRIILEKDLPMNVIAVCGKNEELYKKFTALKSKGNTRFLPVGLAQNMIELVAASDIFCGKGGANTCAEACFFGLPVIMTKYATLIEAKTGKYYIDSVGNALKIFEPVKVVEKLEAFCADRSLMQPYINAALSRKKCYGATECAERIFNLLCTRFPELKEN